MTINPAVPGTLTRIATGDVGAPRLSADGSTIVYTRWVDHQWDIMRWREGQTEAVSAHPHADLDPAVSHDGDVVVWSRHSKPDMTDPLGSFDIVRRSGGVESVLADTGADEMTPALSADGKLVAWIYDDPKYRIGYDVQTWKDGEVSFATTDWPVDTNPLVNDDGSRIFFRRRIDFDGGDLWMRDEQGTVKQLTYSAIPEHDPAIDAGGHTLVWSEDDRGHHRLVRRDVDRDVTTVAASEEGVDHSSATLSGDGTRMAWVREDRRPGQPGDPQIMLDDHGTKIPLTVDGWNAWPRMSRDGRVITWLALEDGQTPAIYRFERSDVPCPAR